MNSVCASQRKYNGIPYSLAAQHIISWLLRSALFLLLCIACKGSSAQAYLYDSWGIKEGLPQNSVNQILQTKDGYIWVATEGGLARFDGIAFTIFNTQNTPALKSNRINRMYENANGDLLIGAYEGGLVMHRNHKFYNISDSLGLPYHSYYRFSTDCEGSIIAFVSESAGLIFHDPDTYGILADTPVVLRSFLNSIFCIDPTDYLFYMDSIAFKSGSKPKLNSAVRPAVQADLRAALPGNVAGEFWTLKKTAICHYLNYQEAECFDFSQYNFNGFDHTLFTLVNDKIYFGELKSEVLVFDIATSGFSTFSFGEVCPDAKLQDVYKDREGNIWYGSTTCGLIKEKPKRFQYIDALGDSQGGNFYPIMQASDKKIWMGSREKGISVYDSLFNPLPLPEGITRNGFSTTLTSYRGDIYFYFIGYGIVTKWDGKNTTHISFDSPKKYGAWALYPSRSDGLLFGAHAGLFKLNDKQELIEHPISNQVEIKDVVGIHEDQKGLIWLVSNAEIMCYDPATYRLLWRTKNENKPKNFYRGIDEDKDGTLYVGSYGNGLMVIKDGVLRRITTAHGLIENVVSTITPDGNGSLWLTGNKGLSRIAKEELVAVLGGQLDKLNVIFYDEQTDALRTGEFNGGMQQSKCHLGGNRYIFPTLKGAVAIDFDRMNFNNLPPPVHVEKLVYADSTFLGHNPVSVPYTEGRLDIYYTALSYVSPKNVRFKYRLEGYENQWTNAGAERKTSYSKIPPGSYTFRVIASNNEGVWNDNGDTLKINITPPFYMTTWFKLFGILLGIAVVGLSANAIIRSNRKQLVDKQRIRLQAIVTTEEQERHRIAKDLHDGVGQLLSSVKMNLSNIEGQTALADQVLQDSKRDIDHIADELRNISYNLLPSSLERFGLATAIEEQINKLENSVETTFHFNKTIAQDRFEPQVEIMLYRIFQEMLNNALKHASASEITVQLSQHKKELQLMLEDNGRGFDLKSGLEKNNSSGLKNLYSRAALINGKIDVDSHPNSGTSIIIEVEL